MDIEPFDDGDGLVGAGLAWVGQAPVFIAHGTEDGGMPIDAAHFLAEELPADGVLELEGRAHAAAFTHAPQLIGPLRAFLDRHA